MPILDTYFIGSNGKNYIVSSEVPQNHSEYWVKAAFAHGIEINTNNYSFYIPGHRILSIMDHLMTTSPAYSSPLASGTDESEIVIIEGATWKPLFDLPIP